jgi:cytochrome c biogenesis protein CcmG/thiol:disulfide interchange protein DsbE
MRRYLVPGLFVAGAVLLIALLVFGVASQGTSSSIDSQVASGHLPLAPRAAQALPNLGHPGSTSLASLRGKVVVLNVFASWCDPCKAEAPVLAAAQRTLVASHRGTILGVTYLDNSNDSESFVRAEHVDYPVVRDISGNFVRAYGATGVPETFVIDPSGRIAAVRRYQIVGEWLNQTLARVLAQPS